MSTLSIDRNMLIGAVSGTAPHLVPWLNGILFKPSYTVPEISAIFRQQVFAMVGEHPTIQAWLVDDALPAMWLYYFCQNVVPFFSQQLRRDYLSPEARNLLLVI